MATTRFRGPVLQGKFNEAGETGFNLNEKKVATAVAIGDSGMTFTSPSGSPTFTLPAVAANEGSVFTFVNTLATSKVGDFVKIGGNAGGTAWTVLDIQGTWA